MEFVEFAKAKEASAPRYIIADRRDLLGGRLIPILNGLRLAHQLGSKFLMTWHSDASDFQRLVAGLDEIFAGELLEPFDPATGKGTLIGIDDPLIKTATASIRGIATPETEMTGIGDALVQPTFAPNPDIPYLLDRRFSKYILPDEDVQ